MNSPIGNPLSSYKRPHFGSAIRLEKPEAFQRGLTANQALAAISQNDPLMLGDSTYQSPGWRLYEQLCSTNKNSAQPVPCYPWGSNSITRASDIYTGAMITGAGGGITDGKTAVRFHLDRQPENLAEMAKPSEESRLKKPLSQHINKLDTRKRSALILGGNTNIPAFQADSRTLLNQLRHFFREQNIKTSYLWGQDSTRDTMAQTRAYYTAQDDTWHILKRFKDPATKVISGPPGSILELSRAFQHIHLSSRDKLYFGSPQEQARAISPLRLNATILLYQFPQRLQDTLKTIRHRVLNFFNRN